MPTDRINFDVNLPALTAPNDVATREVTVTWERGNGPEVQPAVNAAPGDATAASFAPQDAQVSVSLVDVDNAGNRSEPRVHVFVATDSVAPAQPGEFGVTITSEDVGGIPD